MPPPLVVNGTQTKTPFLSVNGGSSAPPPSPSLLSQAFDFGKNVVGGAKAFGTDLVHAAVEPFKTAPKQDLLTNSQKAPLDTAQSLFKNLSDAGAQMSEGASALFDNHQSALDRGIGATHVALGTVQAAFAPINSVITYAQHVPGLGYLATGLNSLFNVIGTGGADQAEGAVEALPISPDAKAKITPVAKQAAALVAQLLVGKVGGEAVSTLADHTRTIVDAVKGAEQVAKTGVEIPTQKLIVNGTSETSPVEFANRYIPPDQLPSIQMGPKAPDTLPVVASSPAETASKAPQGYSYENTVSPVATESSSSAVPVEQSAPEITPTVSSAGKVVTKAASDVNQTLVKQGFEALPPELQSKYTPESYKEELVKSKDLISTDYADAVARISGEKPLGKYEGQILFNEVEREATLQGDGETLGKLAASKEGRELSGAAQTMGAHGYNDNPNSPVALIRSVQEARAAALKAKGASVPKEQAKVETHFKDEVTKARPSKESWSDFAKQIVCNI